MENYYYESIELTALRDVYLPAEDSELLAGAADKEAYGRVLEIGCGSGFVSIVCASKIEVMEVVATDISPSAVKCASANAEKNRISKIKFYRGSLFSALPKNAGKFDFILFNPPYLPTGASEKVHGRLNKALDGGKEGISVACRFLDGAGKFLSPRGRILMIASTAQNLQKLAARAEKNGFGYEVCARHSLFFEELQVWRMWKHAKD